MQHIKTLRVRTKFARTRFAISLILGFALVIFGCDTNKLASSENQVIGMENFEISAEAVPEGILITFSDIPPEIEKITISVNDWGDNGKDAVMKIWDDREPFAVMNTLSHIYMHNNCENLIERVRQTGTITFPFVQPGRKYEITAYYSDSNDIRQGWTEKKARAECVAYGGIYLKRDITIIMNDTFTSVALSSEPAFASDVHLEAMIYFIYIKGDYTVPFLGDVISSGKTNDLFWNFKSRFIEHLKESGVPNGDYPALVEVDLIIIHDNISWMLESVKTPVFTYSF